MASITQSSEPEILDNHKESWLVLLSAAEAYCQKSGCDLAILTACKKFRPSAGDGDGVRKRDSSGAFPRDSDFSYNVWGQGFLAESARRYMDDIGVLHSTTMLTAQKHTWQAGGEGAKLVVDLTSDPGHRGVSGLCCTVTLLLSETFVTCLILCCRFRAIQGKVGWVESAPVADCTPKATRQSTAQELVRDRALGRTVTERGNGRKVHWKPSEGDRGLGLWIWKKSVKMRKRRRTWTRGGLMEMKALVRSDAVCLFL